MKDFFKYLLPPIVWAVLIYFVSNVTLVLPQARIPAGIARLALAFLYFFLCWLARRAFYYQNFALAWKASSYLGAFIFSVVYAFLSEYHRYFIPGRETDFYNVVAATGGALLYVAAAWYLQQSHDQGEEDGEG